MTLHAKVQHREIRNIRSFAEAGYSKTIDVLYSHLAQIGKTKANILPKIISGLAAIKHAEVINN